jgi:hypothetical protein
VDAVDWDGRLVQMGQESPPEICEDFHAYYENIGTRTEEESIQYEKLCGIETIV